MTNNIEIPKTVSTLTPEVLVRFPNAIEGFVPNKLLLLDFIKDGIYLKFNIDIPTMPSVTNVLQNISRPAMPTYANYGVAGSKVQFMLPLLTKDNIDVPIHFIKMEDSDLMIVAQDTIYAYKGVPTQVLVNTSSIDTEQSIALCGRQEGDKFVWHIGISLGTWDAAPAVK
jgi:hypothetical protein